jgi:hypothetical protein
MKVHVALCDAKISGSSSLKEKNLADLDCLLVKEEHSNATAILLYYLGFVPLNAGPMTVESGFPLTPILQPYILIKI